DRSAAAHRESSGADGHGGGGAGEADGAGCVHGVAAGQIELPAVLDGQDLGGGEVEGRARAALDDASVDGAIAVEVKRPARDVDHPGGIDGQAARPGAEASAGAGLNGRGISTSGSSTDHDPKASGLCKARAGPADRDLPL